MNEVRIQVANKRLEAVDQKSNEWPSRVEFQGSQRDRIVSSLRNLSYLCLILIAFGNNCPAFAQSIAFVQTNYSTPQTPQTSVAVTYTLAQTAGNLNVVVVGWNDSAAHVTSVTDNKGNV